MREKAHRKYGRIEKNIEKICVLNDLADVYYWPTYQGNLLQSYGPTVLMTGLWVVDLEVSLVYRYWTESA